MTIEELHSAVLDALERRDTTTGLQLLEPFLETATGVDRGRALSLKANVIFCEPRRAPEGLALIDEALPLLSADPDQYFSALVTAIGLCLNMGDVDKGCQYEATSLALLQTFGHERTVQGNRFRLYINLGLLANLRRQYPTGYWHLVQASSCVSDADLPEGAINQWRVLILLYIADTCILMGRWPEAVEALEKSRPLITNEREQVRWTVRRSQTLRYLKRYREALAELESLRSPDSEWPPTDRARYHLERGLLAQDMGDLRSFHSHMATAHQEAESHGLEFLLCEIQRAQREPIIAEAVK